MRARLFTVLAVSLLAVSAAAQDGRMPGLDGLFPREQAQRGQAVFSSQCATCHTPEQAAELMLEKGGGQRLGDYHTALSALMPPLSPTRPTPQQFVDILAYLARTAGAAPGGASVAFESAAWRQVRLPRSVAAAVAAPKVADIGWANWRGEVTGLAYSPAALIDKTNVGRLAVAWRWSGANFGPSPESRNITTPLMVDGVLYLTAGLTRNVVALDPATGETLWMWRPGEDEARYRNAPRKGAGRGVAYWTDGKDKRIFTVTPGFHLAALDARTGRPVETFGAKGVIDLMADLRGKRDTPLQDIGSQSPPLVVGNVVVVGPAHLASTRPRSRSNVKGDVRAFDARTGKLIWTFHTIPQKGEPGYETWAPGTAEIAGNAGVWAPMSADPRTGAIFLPVESATSDHYGGERPGDNRNASSLVSLDSRTGKVRWMQQIVHHDVWDWDVPAIPILADIPTTTGVRQAVLQITKQSFLYAFDRNTGEPLWPLVERPVPASDVPGEVSAKTQPMPAKPLPFDRQGVSIDDLIDFTPALRAEAIERVKSYRLGAFMAPASLSNAADGTRGTLSLPSIYGGANWEGGAYDPETGMLYVASMTEPSVLTLSAAPEGSDIRYRAGGSQPPNVRGLPIIKPPYGRITAIDMKSGDHAWMIANADTPERYKSNPALAGASIPRTGVASRAGLLATKTLLFAGEGEDGSAMFRAHDKATGAILAQIPLPGVQTGLPMTYVWKGRQYVVMSVSSPGRPAEIVALALPQ